MITKNKINNIIKKCVQNGGATLSKSLNFKSYKKGYQVSILDGGIFDLKNIDSIIKKVYELQQKIKKDEFLGFWIENNQLYIDISKKYQSLNFALIFGKIYNQKSFLIWQNMECVKINNYFSNVA